ncbi:hypothetical protein [Achromobacter sp. AONIH1]|uniref:hypothetical protein n=1 Tax=Achromobacter sp. AONIH1 TaxID=1758194 RepID=UPI000CD2A713|nr:hypothetical protein [Achromobacter sp. AONIH1]AUT44512.1 hypothetical protein C2U31_00110 [Achromobacter sp. AONIH1]
MTDLKGFIENQRMLATVQAQVDWTKRRQKWLRELDELFRWIARELEMAGLRQDAFERPVVKLHEERLGHYDAPSLSVQLPTGLWVDFKPKGSVIIGGYGRVDVQPRHALKLVKLIALDAHEDRSPVDHTPSYDRDWVWRVFPAIGTAGSYALDEAGLGRLFTDVMS